MGGNYRDTVPLYRALNYTVRFVAPFENLMMIHCHILKHEDLGMLTVVDVAAAPPSGFLQPAVQQSMTQDPKRATMIWAVSRWFVAAVIICLFSLYLYQWLIGSSNEAGMFKRRLEARKACLSCRIPFLRSDP